MKSALEVTIAGQRYVLRGDAGQERLAVVANLVSETMERVREHARAASGERIAILTALHVAEQLFEQRDEFEATREQIRQRTERLIACLRSLGPLAVNTAEPAADAPLGQGRLLDG